jgi:hypothetical protein
MATGPVTESGKEQCRINGRKGGRPRKAGAVLSDVATSDVSGETEIMAPEKTGVAEPLLGEDSGRVVASKLQVPVRPELTLEKPKSWMLKDVNVQARCERCTMFASSGACLAVAKGMITNIPAGGDCAAFLFSDNGNR